MAAVPDPREPMSTLHAPAAPRTHHHRGRAKSRDPFFDNAKMLLVTLVVVGHSWTLLPDVSTSSPVYVFLYTFHVPAFVLVTGYLSRSFTFTRANLRKLVTTVVVPYFVFETLLALFRTVVGHENFGVLYISPHWPMWYLTVLFLWRLATPLLTRMRPGVAMAARGRGLPGRRAEHRRRARPAPHLRAAAVLRRRAGDDPRAVRLAGPPARAGRRRVADGADVRGRDGRRRQLQQGVALLAHRLPRPGRPVLARRLRPARPARRGRDPRAGRALADPPLAALVHPARARPAWSSTCSTGSS